MGEFSEEGESCVFRAAAGSERGLMKQVLRKEDSVEGEEHKWKQMLMGKALLL